MVISIILLGSIALVSLLALHFLSPEYQMSWRMISEYALGKYKWLLTLFFVSWGLASMLLAIGLWHEMQSIWAKIGLVLVFVSGIGAVMGGLFDLKHKFHGFSFALGVPTLPIGALLVAYHMVSFEEWAFAKNMILTTSHSLWMSMVLMGITLGKFMGDYKKTGLPMGPDIEPPKTLPVGVLGIHGYFNRLLVVCYIGWIILMAHFI
jgi:hypothetical membrane protein